MNEIFYLNGALLPGNQAKVSILDYGFLYGYGLYETARAYGDRVFRLDHHLARLRHSGDRLGIKVHTALIRQAVLDVVQANGFKETRIRITLSAGEGSMTPNLASCGEPTIAVLATEYTPPAPEKYRQGYKLMVASIRRNSRSPVTFMKSANMIEHMMARQEAKNAGVDEALFLNEKGYVTETAGCNLFLVRGNELRTPRFEAGILPGVTRVVVFELATRLGIRIKEINITLAELIQADEVFLTNSLIEIMPVSGIAGKSIGTENPGDVTKRLMSAYRELVEKETQ